MQLTTGKIGNVAQKAGKRETQTTVIEYNVRNNILKAGSLVRESGKNDNGVKS